MDFESIYSTYFKEVYYFLLKLSKNENIAEEVTSETFFKALESIEDYRGDSSIRTYLFGIAKNTYFSYFKKAKREIPVEDMAFFDEKIESVENIVLNKERNIGISEAIDLLKDPYRTVVLLRIWEDMSFKQIGKVYDKTDNWACVTFHRAKKLLKEMLEEDYGK